MRIEQFTACMERIAPLSLAESWDNCGLLIRPEAEEITRVLVALDCTEPVAREAAAVGAQLVLTHHPLLLSPVKRLSPQDPDTAAAWRLIRSGVGLYAAHTCLDRAQGGVNDTLAQCLGLCAVQPLPEPGRELGMGRVGRLETEVPLCAFAKAVQEKLSACVRFCGEPDRPVHTVAVLGGAGGDFIADAAAAGADVLVTGEVKHHQALLAQSLGIALIEAGHYETERPVLKTLIYSLQREENRLQYKDSLDFVLSGIQRAPLVGV